MPIFKSCLFFILCLFASLQNMAQNKPAKKSETIAVEKFKSPKLQTFIENYKDSVSITAEEAVRIIDKPIKIYDDKKKEYTISTYQFLYRKIGVTEDEKGNLKPTSTISSERFKITPLPELWSNLIKQQVKSGEEFYFFDVIAKDSQGRVMYSSNLKIMIR